MKRTLASPRTCKTPCKQNIKNIIKNIKNIIKNIKNIKNIKIQNIKILIKYNLSNTHQSRATKSNDSPEKVSKIQDSSFPSNPRSL